MRHRSPANQVRHDDPPLGARIADRVTAVFGSWGFILIQTALIVVWLGYNGYAAVHYLHSRQFDPYPFILLNLLFSTQAAYAAPLILLSQNRTTERDRVKAEHDFDVNVLALRSLAEILGDIHDPTAQQRLRTRIEDLLGSDPEKALDPPTVPAPPFPPRPFPLRPPPPDQHRAGSHPSRDASGAASRWELTVWPLPDSRRRVSPHAGRCGSPRVSGPPLRQRSQLRRAE